MHLKAQQCNSTVKYEIINLLIINNIYCYLYVYIASVNKAQK